MSFRKKVSILGSVTGSIVDIVGTNIWGLVMMVYVLISRGLLQTAQISPAGATERVLEIFRTDPLVFTINLVVGAMFSILGGYISAWIAKHDELLNGALSSFLCVSSEIYGLFTGAYTVPLVLAILSLVISPLLGTLGGYLRLKQRSRWPAPPPVGPVIESTNV